MTILDIDLDFFVSPIKFEVDTSRRLPEAEFKVEDIESALRFLESNCCLPLDSSVPGALFEHHDEVFDYAVQNFPPQLDWVHVDAHADIGGGWIVPSWQYIFCEYTTLDLKARRTPLRGPKGLNCGNFMLFLAGCGMLKEVRFVTPSIWKSDLQPIFMEGHTECSNAIQLKRYDRDVLRSCLFRPLAETPHEVEQAIPFVPVKREDFELLKQPDFVLLTRSPGYTPKSADRLYDAVASRLDLKSPRNLDG